jgi:hypothetical protein
MAGMMRRLPASLREIAEVIGEDAVERLTAAVGGTEVYIPAAQNLRDDHWLVKVLGRADALRLAEHLQIHPVGGRSAGGGCLEVPLMAKTKRELILESSGTNREVALKLRCTTTYVSRVRMAARRRA